MITAAVFQAAWLGVSFVVRPAFSHAIPLMKFVQQYVTTLYFDYGIIDPNLILRNELVDIVMTTFSKVDIEDTAHEAPINNPDAYSVL